MMLVGLMLVMLVRLMYQNMTRKTFLAGKKSEQEKKGGARWKKGGAAREQKLSQTALPASSSLDITTSAGPKVDHHSVSSAIIL